MEYLDIVDENNNLIGKSAEREDTHLNGIWHREVSVWIANDKGELLLQKRSTNKKEKPNQWGTCSGHIATGETIEESLIRELKEEIGFTVTIQKLELIGIEKVKNESPGRKNYHFKYLYFVRSNWPIDKYTIQLEELSEIKYVPFNELKKMIANGDPTLTFSKQEYTIKLLEELEKRI